MPRTCIALVNRKKSRIFELHEAEITQRPDLEFGPSPHVPRSDGFQGYDAGHRERHVENQVMQHFKMFAESLLSIYNREKFDALLIGCQDDSWPEIESMPAHQPEAEAAGKVSGGCCLRLRQKRSGSRRTAS